MQIRVGYSKSEIWNCPDNLIPSLLKKFSYTNTSISYKYSQHLKGRFRFLQSMTVTKKLSESDAIHEYNKETKRLKEAKSVCLIKQLSDRTLEIPTGLVPKLTSFFQEKIKGFNAQNMCIDIRKKPAETYGFAIRGDRPILYHYQKDALQILLTMGQGTIESGTGTGKTLIIQELLRELGLKAVVIMPTLSILNQTVKRFEEYFGKQRIGVYGGGKKKIKDITLTCAPSIAKSNPSEWKDVDIVIADECHHVPCNTVEKIFYEILPNAYYRFGFTATNFRTDGATIAIEAATFPVVFKYSLVDGIREGFLAKPTFVMFKVPWTASKYTGKHPTFVYKNHILRNRKFNEKVKEQIQKLVSAGDKVLVLVREKEHGHYFQQFVPGSVFVRNKESSADAAKLSYVAPYVDSHKAVKAFNAGETQCLIGTSIIGEGTDIIPVDTLMLLTGGVSKVTVLQNIGRGLRRCPGKEKVTIIDYLFTNNAMLQKHSVMRHKYYKDIAGEVHVFDL